MTVCSHKLWSRSRPVHCVCTKCLLIFPGGRIYLVCSSFRYFMITLDTGIRIDACICYSVLKSVSNLFSHVFIKLSHILTINLQFQFDWWYPVYMFNCMVLCMLYIFMKLSQIDWLLCDVASFPNNEFCMWACAQINCKLMIFIGNADTVLEGFPCSRHTKSQIYLQQVKSPYAINCEATLC